MLFLRAHGVAAGGLLSLVSTTFMLLLARHVVFLDFSLAHPRLVLPWTELVGVHSGVVIPALLLPGLASWERPHVRLALRSAYVATCLAAVALMVTTTSIVLSLHPGAPRAVHTVASVWLLTATSATLTPWLGPLAGPSVSLATYWTILVVTQMFPEWSASFPLSMSASAWETVRWAAMLTLCAALTAFITGGQSKLARQLARHERVR